MSGDGAALVRVAESGDASSIAEIYGYYVRETPISFEETAPSATEMKERLAAGLATFPWLVAEMDGVVSGFAYASRHRERASYRWSVDVSAYVRHGLARQGLGRLLYSQLLDILVRQGFVNAYAGITLPNTASVGLHESFGFTPVGVYENVGFKFGKWHSVGWWQKSLNENLPQVKEPTDFVDL